MLGAGKHTPAASIVERIQDAIKKDRVTGLAGALSRLEADGDLADPALYAPPCPAHYARRLIWEDAAGRFVIVGMTWEPAQGSPLHDHDGLWGAEIIVDGLMRETSFRALESDARERVRFVCDREEIAAPRSIGIVIPPLEYHSFRNMGTATAHTVHVYGGVLNRCTVFSPDTDGWWTRRRAELQYDG